MVARGALQHQQLRDSTIFCDSLIKLIKERLLTLCMITTKKPSNLKKYYRGKNIIIPGKKANFSLSKC